MLGDLLDNRYRIIKTLSKGGFGQTYIAEDTRRPGAPHCVMKHLKPMVLDPTHLDNARRLFQTEAIALEKLGHHPQIPRLLAYFEENNDFYLVQDLIRGYPLTKELKPSFQWLEADIYQLLYDVLSILIFVHDRGVIHRDIKPDNLIRRQVDRTLVLVDFGSVKQIRTHLPPSDETGHTISIGTIGYMSTEQARGRPRPNSDLYSLGIIGIQAATGIKPKHFQEDPDTGELVWRHQANISDDLAHFLEKMVTYHFKDRYTDAREALRALKQIQIGSTPRQPLTVEQQLLNNQSYWSRTASRIATAMTSLKSDFGQGKPSQPTFIELPDPKDTPELPPTHLAALEPDQTVAMAYSSPHQVGSDATTADLVNALESQGPTMSSAHLKNDQRPLSPVSSSLELDGKSQEKQENERDECSGVSAVSIASDGYKPSIDRFSDGFREMYPAASLLPNSVSSLNEPAVILPPSQVYWRRLKSVFQSVGILSFKRWDGLRHSQPSEITRYMLLAFGGLGLIAVVGLSANQGYQRFQSWNQTRLVTQVMQNDYNQGSYEACQQRSAQFSLPSNSVPDQVLTIEYQCTLQLAEQLAGEGEWERAIAQSTAIPVEAPEYDDAQRLIRKRYWAMLSAAVDEYEQGNLNQAIHIAREIPSGYPLHAEVQLALLKWNSEQQLWKKLSSGLLDNNDNGEFWTIAQLESVINRLQPLEQSPVYRDLANALREEANFKKDQIEKAETETEAVMPTIQNSSTPAQPPGFSPPVPRSKVKP